MDIATLYARLPSFTMADAEAPPVGEPPKAPECPSPFEQKSPYYAKRIELFEKYFEREGTKVEEAKTTNERQGWLPLAYFKQTNKRLAGKPVIFR